MDLDDLRARFGGSGFLELAEPGAWFKGDDSAIGWSGKPSRRFLLVAPYEGGPSARMAPRSKQQLGNQLTFHSAHPHDHQPGCGIDSNGYIVLRSFAVHRDCISRYYCDDPDATLITTLREAARKLGGRI